MKLMPADPFEGLPFTRSSTCATIMIMVTMRCTFHTVPGNKCISLNELHLIPTMKHISNDEAQALKQICCAVRGHTLCPEIFLQHMT